LFVQHLLFTEITCKDLIQIHKIYQTQIVISIHDFCWFHEEDCWIDPKNSYYEHAYLKNVVVHPTIIDLFKNASLVIHPSSFTKKHYERFFPHHNSLLQYHNDIEVTPYTKYLPSIVNKTIHIAHIQGLSEYKGYKNVMLLIKKYKHYKNYNIQFHIIGLNKDKYSETNWHDFIIKSNFHCLLHLNKFGETYSYTLSKSLNSGLPILYNNIGAYKERIHSKCGNHSKSGHYIKVIDHENDYYNTNLLFQKFETMLNYIIQNNGNFNSTNNNNTIVYNSIYKNIFHTYSYLHKPYILNVQNNHKNIFDNVTIILTTTININKNKLCLFQKNKQERISTYLRSVYQWLYKTFFKWLKL
jgi:hypothetical protein